MPSFNTLAVLFAAAITLHNIEEAIWLPGWSKTAGRWHHPIASKTFRFAVTVLTLLSYAFATLAIMQGKQSIGAYLLTGYALAMFLNVFMPHTVATLALRRYAPGIVTAVFLNFPITSALVYVSVSQEYVNLNRFYIAGPAVVLGILASIPALFFIGNRLFESKSQCNKRQDGHD